MPDTFTIRPATNCDHAALCALFEQMDELHRAHLPWRFRKPPTPARSESYFEALVQGAESTVLGVYQFNEAARGFHEAVGYAPIPTRLRKPLGSPDVDR